MVKTMINEIVGLITFLSVFSNALDNFNEFGGAWNFLKVLATGIMAFIATAGWILVLLNLPYFILDLIGSDADKTK